MAPRTGSLVGYRHPSGSFDGWLNVLRTVTSSPRSKLAPQGSLDSWAIRQCRRQWEPLSAGHSQSLWYRTETPVNSSVSNSDAEDCISRPDLSRPVATMYIYIYISVGCHHDRLCLTFHFVAARVSKRIPDSANARGAVWGGGVQSNGL